ncbi:hypothetical protein F5884DRAFT_851093 [Xylogone sp. PMI_703]|nr:hypothetical protein F5884DRAFT_851093 [Xylogone sp. PMI_703]
MSAPKPHHDGVAIIGAGPAGLALALTLHKHGVACVVYESRSQGFTLGGAIMLAPNALRILDSLGIYENIKRKGFNFEAFTFKNDVGEDLNHFFVGHQDLYGYQALRISRQVVIAELQAAAMERGIPIHFNKHFTRIISKDTKGVVFEFDDKSLESSSFVIGADGIHSKVRQYLSPSIKPTYSGQLAITSRIKRCDIQFPEIDNYPLPVAIYGKNGAFLIIPEDFNGDDIVFGTQTRFPERDRAGWQALLSQKDELMALLNAKFDTLPGIIRSCLKASQPEGLSIWPYYVIPDHDKWISESNRVILLGDAAHAIPPTGGQGACMAFEDGYSLGTLLSELTWNDPAMLHNAIGWWQTTRHARVEKVLALTQQLGELRLPQSEREKLARERGLKEDLIQGVGKNLHWLYTEDQEAVISSWLRSHSSSVADT